VCSKHTEFTIFILLFSISQEEHLQHLRVVLDVLAQHDLRINRKKCIFEQPSLEYLGHIISAEGVAVDPKKLEAM